ncbi:MAG: hypothetical protein Q4E22_04550 [Coriobacteriia bacterium]|nr:hypothetical protein [Coriobacteriia bacterium]
MPILAMVLALVFGVLPMMAQTALASENGGALRLKTRFQMQISEIM